MFKLKKSMILTATILTGLLSFGIVEEVSAAVDTKAKGDIATIKAEKLTLTNEWDKVFAKSKKVNHRKVTFVNRLICTSRKISKANFQQ